MALLIEDFEQFPAHGRVYSAERLGEMVTYAKERIDQLQDQLRLQSRVPLDFTASARVMAAELSSLLPQLDPALLELIKAHVAPKEHVDTLDAEILAERIRCARIVADLVSPKRLELILSGEDSEVVLAQLTQGGISG
jgi:hypothetical protein